MSANIISLYEAAWNARDYEHGTRIRHFHRDQQQRLERTKQETVKKKKEKRDGTSGQNS